MTVDQLIDKLQELNKAGHGDLPVYHPSSDFSMWVSKVQYKKEYDTFWIDGIEKIQDVVRIG